MKKFVTLLALLFAIFIGAQTAQACSITASGSCGGSACPSGQSCSKVSDTECSCVDDDKSPIAQSLEQQITAAKAEENKDKPCTDGEGCSKECKYSDCTLEPDECDEGQGGACYCQDGWAVCRCIDND